jgi:hypothetical protein
MFLLAVTLSVVGQMLVIYFPPLQMVFQTEALMLTGRLQGITAHSKLASNKDAEWGSQQCTNMKFGNEKHT